MTGTESRLGATQQSWHRRAAPSRGWIPRSSRGGGPDLSQPIASSWLRLMSNAADATSAQLRRCDDLYIVHCTQYDGIPHALFSLSPSILCLIPIPGGYFGPAVRGSSCQPHFRAIRCFFPFQRMLMGPSRRVTSSHGWTSRSSRDGHPDLSQPPASSWLRLVGNAADAMSAQLRRCDDLQ